MAEFRDISEFTLKSVLDGTEEIQISAENKTNLLQIAKLALGELFKLSNFQGITSGFSGVQITDTLMQALQKFNLGFENGSARLVVGTISDGDHTGFGVATTEGAFAFFYDIMCLSFATLDTIEMEAGDLLQSIWDNSDLDLYVDQVTTEEANSLSSALTSYSIKGGNTYNMTTSATTMKTLSLDTFDESHSSAVIFGITSTTAPSITTSITLYKPANWDNVWAQAGTKVLAFQWFKGNIIVVNVGLYNKA
jgi:hypothetical protein